MSGFRDSGANVLSAIARGVDKGAHVTRAMSPTSKGIGIGATVLGLGGLAGTLAFVRAKKAAAERAEEERLEAEERLQRREAERLEEQQRLEAIEAERKEAERIEAEAKRRLIEAEAKQKRIEAEAEQRRLEEQRRVEAEAEQKRIEAEAEKKRVEAEAEQRRLEEQRRVEKRKRIEAEAEKKRVDTEAEQARLKEQKRLEAAAKKAAEEANMAAAAKKAAEEAASKAKEDARKAQEAKNAEGTKKTAEDAKKAQKAADEATLQKREADRIATAQKTHAERAKRGDPIELTPIEIAHDILAYYAERTDLQVPERLAEKLTPGPVYFVFERLCRATVAFWKRFVQYQREQTEILGHGAGAFEKTIDLYTSGCEDKYDMWVAYVAEAKPLTIADREKLLENENDETKIEMVVTVFVHRHTPVTSHMGIFRTDRYWHEDRKLGKSPYYMIPAGHKGISPLIHAFAACAALCLYKHLRDTKSVMLTRPVHVMSKILRDALGPGEIRVGSPDERTKSHVGVRARKHANHPDGGYSNDMYTPPLAESGSLPFFARSGSTWTFDGAAYDEPEWMSGKCEHTDVTPRAHDKSSLEHTVLLSALARTWSAPSDQASERGSRDASKCSIVVGHTRIPVQCDAGKVTVDDHPCLDDWASKWNEIPRIAPFDFALGALESGRTCPVVEIHNKADGNCLLYALGLYLCVTQQGWNEDVTKLRHNIMDEVERMLNDPSGTFEGHRISVQDEAYPYTDKQRDRWTEHAKSTKIDADNAVSKYIFVNKMDRVDLGDLEIVAFARRYGIRVCVWQEEKEPETSDRTVLGRILMVPDDGLSNVVVRRSGVIPDYGPCVHLRYYKKRTKKGEEPEDGQTGDGGHYTLLALLDSEDPGFGRRRHRYV